MTYSLILTIYFFFNDTATTEIYTLSLHDALPIYRVRQLGRDNHIRSRTAHSPMIVIWIHNFSAVLESFEIKDRKSTRLNSSHMSISYAVFCLKKKKSQKTNTLTANHFITRHILLL